MSLRIGVTRSERVRVLKAIHEGASFQEAFNLCLDVDAAWFRTQYPIWVEKYGPGKTDPLEKLKSAGNPNGALPSAAAEAGRKATEAAIAEARADLDKEKARLKKAASEVDALKVELKKALDDAKKLSKERPIV